VLRSEGSLFAAEWHATDFELIRARFGLSISAEIEALQGLITAFALTLA